MMAWFSVVIGILTILSLSVNPGFTQVLADEDSIQLISLTYPFNFTSSTSISLEFNFTIGNGVALAIIPTEFPSKFGTNMSFEVLDTHQFLGIQFYASVLKISYSGDTIVSKSSNVLKEGGNLSSWIEYQRISRRLEVRLTKLNDPKPVEPLISVPLDLEKILKGEEVVFGLACSKTRHEKSTSWRLDINKFRLWEAYFGDLRDHVLLPLPPFPPMEHSSVEETYKENNGFVSWFTLAIIVCVLFMFFAWSIDVGGQKVQAGGYKHGTTESLEMKKNSEALSSEEC